MNVVANFSSSSTSIFHRFIGIKHVVDIQNGALSKPTPPLTVKSVSFLLTYSPILSIHTAGFIIEYLT
jgi:hypothetical protein